MLGAFSKLMYGKARRIPMQVMRPPGTALSAIRKGLSTSLVELFLGHAQTLLCHTHVCGMINASVRGNATRNCWYTGLVVKKRPLAARRAIGSSLAGASCYEKSHGKNGIYGKHESYNGTK